MSKVEEFRTLMATAAVNVLIYIENNRRFEALIQAGKEAEERNDMAAAEASEAELMALATSNEPVQVKFGEALMALMTFAGENAENAEVTADPLWTKFKAIQESDGNIGAMEPIWQEVKDLTSS